MNQQAKYAEIGLKTEFLGEGSDPTASNRVLRGETIDLYQSRKHCLQLKV